MTKRKILRRNGKEQDINLEFVKMKKEENINEDKGHNERFSNSSKWRKRILTRIKNKMEDS